MTWCSYPCQILSPLFVQQNFHLSPFAKMISQFLSDVMKPIAAPMVGGMITSTIHVLVPVFFVLMKERALRGARCGRI